MLVTNVIAREILDSRGNPTVEVELFSNNKSFIASVPSGASTGSKEALELRDNDSSRYSGKGVLTAVNNVNTIIKEAIINKELDQSNLDNLLIELDGTDNKSKLGANAMLGVSLAFLKASADNKGQELYEYLSNGNVRMPIPMMNIINGGMHSDSGLSVQEFMIVPVVKTFKERLRLGSEVFHSLKEILKSDGYNVSVGDEGGFAPKLASTKEALNYILKSINKTGYTAGKDVFIALDVAANSIYNENDGTYLIDNKSLTKEELLNYYQELVNDYPICSIEDPFYEEDFDSLMALTSLIGNKVMLVGDDYFVTNKKLLQNGINKKAGNAILLKANQIGTVSEMLETINLAKENGYQMVISHRSGETEDTFIADFAVGCNLNFIKSGSLSRGERINKYNRLLRIEEKLIK